jgi:diguanylate cyclase (GGDEF)-like protein
VLFVRISGVEASGNDARASSSRQFSHIAAARAKMASTIRAMTRYLIHGKASGGRTMSSSDTRILLDLLRATERMSGRRDREDLFHDLCQLVRGALRADAVLLYSVRLRVDGVQVLPVGWSVADTDGGRWSDVGGEGNLPADPFLGTAIAAKAPWYRVHGDQQDRIAIPASNGGRVTWVLEIELHRSPSTRVLHGLVTLVRTFEHLMSQWEHANLDTLTGLLNRKTFDDQFDRLIALAERNRARERERHAREGDHPCWLGIVDIDHFKLINDTWGHLFGDEVLILMAKHMRESFRVEDTLFRFGGEEFVVMLRHVPETAVTEIFERFSQTIRGAEFPQVGQVTVSVGFCLVDVNRTPAELLARADAALYYAKDHGRDRVCSHEALAAEGLIKPVTAHSAQQDADAFF